MKISVTFPLSFKNYVKEIENPLTENGCTVVVKFFDVPPPKRELVDFVKQADVYVPGSVEEIDREIIESAPNLCAIMRFGAGYNNVDLSAAREKNIYVTNVPEENADSVAELTIALILTLARRIPYCHQLMIQNHWQVVIGEELKGKTLGIVGLGAIGKRVVKKIQGFEMKIVGYDVKWNYNFAKRWRVEQSSLDNLLRVSDYITIHVPLNKATKNMISHEQFSVMKKQAYLINTSRGGVVDEKALIEALKTGQIAGAALDVFHTEPLKKSKLQQLNNVILTPHVGGSTREAIKRVIRKTVENILRIKEGKKPLNVVNDL